MKPKNEDSWEELLEKLRTDYKLSIRDICEILKASRSWVNKYIRPHCDSVYINSNIRGEKRTGISWQRIASIQLGLEEPLTESIYLNYNDFFNLMYDSIYSITKQTKLVPAILLVDNKAEYKKEYAKINDEIIELNIQLDAKLKEDKHKAIDIACQIADLETKRDRLHLEFMSAAKRLIVVTGQASIVERSKAEAMDFSEYYKKHSCDISEFMAPHDVKSYGDTDEQVYRTFFKRGCVRFELHFTDKLTGEIGKKVFYVPDPEPLIVPEEDSEYNYPMLLIKEKSWDMIKQL